MAKFQAMMDMLSLVVPFIERDEKGQVVRDQTIVFNTGIRTGKEKVTPASISTSKPDELKYLRAYGGNEANGGTSFREIVEKPVEKKTEVAKEATKATPEPVAKVSEPAAEAKKEFVFPDDLAKKPTPSTEITEYPEITTVQLAGSVLRRLDPTLKTRDVSSKDKVTALAVKYNITFPNL